MIMLIIVWNQFFWGGNWEDVQANIPTNTLCGLGWIYFFFFEFLQVSLSAFSFLFSELVQYNQTQVENITELERRLSINPHCTGILMTPFDDTDCWGDRVPPYFLNPIGRFVLILDVGAGWRMQAMLLVRGYWNFFAIVKRYGQCFHS